MIEKLKRLLGGLTGAGDSDSDEETRLDLAVAVLLVEMARADHDLAAMELSTIKGLLENTFGLDEAAVTQLLNQAHATAEDSVSMHEFTRAIHAGMDYDEKLRVIEMLWRVALVDQNLDKYEDYLIAKLGELLYVSRGDVIRLRHRVISESS